MSKKPVIIAVSLVIVASALVTCVALAAPSSADRVLANRLKGRILLQAQDRGQLWYVDTKGQRHALTDPSTAWAELKSQTITVTSATLSKIPTSSSRATGTISVRRSYSGKLLVVKGDARNIWYVLPTNLKRYYFDGTVTSFRHLATLALGISNANLARIAVAPTTVAVVTTPAPTPSPTIQTPVVPTPAVSSPVTVVPPPTPIGCAYGTARCVDGYECVNNSCTPIPVRTGCSHNNPPCDASHDCVNNSCFLKQGCAYTNPGCSAGQDCVNNACVQRVVAKSCALEPSLCSASEFCINGACWSSAGLLPTNSVASEACSYDEVYRNGRCEKAGLTITFVGSALTDEAEFNAWINHSMAVWAYESPFRDCPDKIRIHRDFNFCAPPDADITRHMKSQGASNFHFFMLHPLNVFDPNCSSNYGELGGHMAVWESNRRGWSGLAHEIGHIYGLWDQYCYYPSADNPNPTDFVAGQCRETTDPWYQIYCSRDRLGRTYEPYQCVGNPTPNGSTSIMGTNWADSESAGVGFSEVEMRYLRQKISCD